MNSTSTQKIEGAKSIKKPLTNKAVKVLADSIYETLRSEGCEEKDIIGVSSQLISLVTSQMEQDQ